MPYEILKNELLISHNKMKLDIPFVYNYLSKESYWAQGIPEDVVLRSIDNSTCFGIYIQGEQIGFARVVSDKATFAYLADVFIVEAHCGRGISKWLIETIHAHPYLQGLRRWLLTTKDAHGLYAKLGWRPLADPARFMQRHFPGIYKIAKQ